MIRSILFMVLGVSPAFASEYALKDGDEVISQSGITDRLIGQVVEFYDGGRSTYYQDGRYSYTYSGNDGTAFGHWHVGPDNEVCVSFTNGASRCDLYVLNNDRLVLITEDGHRFPVRP